MIPKSDRAVLQRILAQTDSKSNYHQKNNGQRKQGHDNGNGAEWQCLCKDCDSAVRRRKNRPDRTACFSCLRPKGQAMSPPLASTVGWALRGKKSDQEQH